MKATSVLCVQLTPVHLYPENLGLPSFENHGHSFPPLRHFPKLNVSELAEILSLLIIPSFSASEDQFPVNYTNISNKMAAQTAAAWQCRFIFAAHFVSLIHLHTSFGPYQLSASRLFRLFKTSPNRITFCRNVSLCPQLTILLVSPPAWLADMLCSISLQLLFICMSFFFRNMHEQGICSLLKIPQRLHLTGM